jgi:hypothetical protein
MDELPTDVKHTIANFDAKLAELETLLTPFLSEEKNLLPRLNPLDTAKLNLTVSYAITTLFSLYLKTQGLSPADHPVKKEMDRIKQHLEKLKSAAGEPSSSTTDQGSSKKRKTPEGGSIPEETSPKKQKDKSFKR